ncbi:MAG: potassium/proton antiporter [Myxococcales bacterium]|nr:MAG: potassium/proton antiporter [Myxococcales bacterium]
MSFSLEVAVLVGGVLLLAAVLAGKLSSRLGIPSLLVFLAVGMLAGSEGIGGIEFESAEVARSVGEVALLIILFAGGLATDWRSVRPVLAPGLVLATVGVALPTLVLGSCAWFLLGEYSSFDLGTTGLTWPEALLLAAIVSSTDAAAVFSVFRTSNVRPSPRLRALLEFESGSNDPMAVLLTTGLLGFMTGSDGSAGALAGTLASQLLLGGLIGFVLGLLGAWLVNRADLPDAGLYPLQVTAFGLVAFGGADLIGGNGFLAVYVTGVALGNRIDTEKAGVLAFHDGLSWLAQIAMFVVLGLLVFPSRMLGVAPVSIALGLLLMFVARPVAVVVCLLPFRPKRNELAYTSWVGLRGSVPIVLSTFPASYGVARGDQIFDVVFFLVITSVLIQGLTLVPSARWLGVTQTNDTP